MDLVDRRLRQIRGLLAGSSHASPIEVGHAQASLAGAEAERVTLVGEPAANAWAEVARRWEELDQAYPAAWCRTCEAEARLSAGERHDGAAALGQAYVAARSMGAEPLMRRIQRLAALARVDLGRRLTNGPDGDVSDPTSAVQGPEPAERPPRPYGLTEREIQVLPLLAAGRTNRQIAEALFMSESTAGVHVSRVIGKMGVANRVEAAALAVRSGLAEET
jgi:DNA-binding CsgD family transcriptional regulator